MTNISISPWDADQPLISGSQAIIDWVGGLPFHAIHVGYDNPPQ